jgi:hypothetical protein
VRRKECFGSIKEVILQNGFTQIETKPECRDCQEFRDCLRFGKQGIEEKREDGEELRKQDMIAKIIDLSHVVSNEIGSCLLEFLNRIYNSPLGTILFKNLLLFYEVPKDTLSATLTIPIPPSTLNLIQREEAKMEDPLDQPKAYQQGSSKKGICLYIVLIQRSFPKNRKANMGLIAYELARLFSSDSQGIGQILQTLNTSEIDLFKKMDAEQRINWLMERWGFLEELQTFRKAIGPSEIMQKGIVIPQ